MAESGRDDSADMLVGRLIRSYRDDARRNGRRLSQDGLIDLMIERGEEYAAGLDRSSISRWESGARPAPREFLVAFGRVLDIPKGEMDRMLSVAGYDSLRDEERRDAILSAAQRIETQVASLQRDVRTIADWSASHPVDASAVAKSALRRLAPPTIYAIVVGFVLNAMGLNGTLALLIYVLVAFAIVIGQVALRWLKPGSSSSEQDHIVDLFFISLFLTMDTSLLLGALTKSDHFGFYTIAPFTNTPMPFLLTMLAHLALSLIASVMFSILWTRQKGAVDGRGTFSRAVWTALPPILFAYVTIAVFTNLGAWMFFIVVFGILFGAFTMVVALNEPGMVVEDAGAVLRTTVFVITVLCSFGAAGALVSYMDPGAAITASEFRIIPLREITPEELGYTHEEGVELLRLGILWMSLATIVYLSTVLGSYVLVTIRRAAPAAADDTHT